MTKLTLDRFARGRRPAAQPRPAGCEKLTGEDLYRIRQGDYRIVYSIADRELIVHVIRIANRRDV